MLLLKKTILHKYDCFVIQVDSSRLHLTFVTVCLLSVVRKKYLKRYNYYVDQSELLTRFRTDFTSSVWNFCRRGADVSPGKTALRRAARRSGCLRRLSKTSFEGDWDKGNCLEKCSLTNANVGRFALVYYARKGELYEKSSHVAIYYWFSCKL